MRKYVDGTAIAVVGMQYGSEAKGAISAYLARGASAVVRTGAANAGHTVYHNGEPYVMQQLPSGWMYPHCHLVIGRGALISLEVLLSEVERFDRMVPLKHRLYVDASAHVITDDQIKREQLTALRPRISSTSATKGLGIGVAQADKVLRSAGCVQAGDLSVLDPYLIDTVLHLDELFAHQEVVLFEGTQGFGLSLEHGFFPYVTSRDTTVAALMASAGVCPNLSTLHTIGVVRSHPIRVGGHSGPFDADSVELSWHEVQHYSGATWDVTERTSVTDTVRRVATFSWQGFERACVVNKPTELAFTFADYIDASVYNRPILTNPIYAFIERLEEVAGVPVTMVKTGPRVLIDLDENRRRVLRKLNE